MKCPSDHPSRALEDQEFHIESFGRVLNKKFNGDTKKHHNMNLQNIQQTVC